MLSPNPSLLGARSSGGDPKETLDIRDSITAMVGKGYTSIADDEARSHFARLVNALGLPKAQKVMSHIFLYNQSPNNKSTPLQQKIMQFYDSGSKDTDVDEVIKQSKGIGTGVVAGLNSSPETTVMQLTNRVPVNSVVAAPTNANDAARLLATKLK